MISKDIIPYVTYVGDNTDDEFAIPFPTYEVDDVVAIITDLDGVDHTLVLGTDYTLAGIGIPTYNGSVQVNSSLTLVDDGQIWISGGNLAEDYVLLIRFSPVASQPYNIFNLGRTSVHIFMLALDRLAMMIKSIRYDVGKALTLAGEDSEDGVSGTFPPVAGNGGRIVIVAPTEDGFAYADFPDSLPAGGLQDQIITLDVFGDPVWDNMVFEGYSSRFNANFSSAGIRDTLSKILDFSYLAPLITLSASGSGAVREKGTVVSGTLLTAAVTKRSDDIDRIQFLRNGSPINTQEPPSNTGSGNTTYTDAGDFSDTRSYTANVRDDGESGGPTVVTSNTVTFNFVYPYYHGCGVPSLSAANVALLTKSVIASNGNLNRDFTSANGDVYYFAYPASYGALTSILDENGFETFADWTLRTENITGLDGNPVSYRIYEFNNPVIAGTTDYTFVR